uniref:Uncharacterized protein n=1 Tax=Arundo donax TaxID=35708 RepID=A0A0A9FUG2_ARUDO
MSMWYVCIPPSHLIF